MPTLPRFDLRALAADAAQFAYAFPAIAGRLARAAGDPSTERLVEGSQYLAATVLDKIEDFQESAHERLAQRASPWLRRPLPAATIVAFETAAARSDRVTIPAGTLLSSPPLEGISCTFRSLAATSVGGYRVQAAALESRPGRAPLLRISLESTTDGPLNEALGQGLSLFIDGELENALEWVHLLTSQLEEGSIASKDWTDALPISSDQVERGGLAPEEALAPDPDGPPGAFGVVTEALWFPHRFRFVTLRGLEGCAKAKATRAVTLTFVLKGPVSPNGHFGTDHVRTGCATVSNLFEAAADPIPLDLERGPVPIRVAGLPPRAASVYAVREAWATASRGEHGPLPLPDVRRLGAAPREPGSPAAFATALARLPGGDPVTTIAFRRLAGMDDVPRVVTLHLLATNGAHPGHLRSGDLAGAIDAGGRSVRFRSVVASSPYVPPPLGEAFSRRAIRLAAVMPGSRDLLGALKDALFLAVPSWTGAPETIRALHLRIEGLRALDVSVARRVVSERATRHGYAYRLTVDESAFQGVGDLSLFGAALGEALARSTPVGTFAELTVLGAKTGFRAVYPSRSRT